MLVTLTGLCSNFYFTFCSVQIRAPTTVVWRSASPEHSIDALLVTRKILKHNKSRREISHCYQMHTNASAFQVENDQKIWSQLRLTYTNTRLCRPKVPEATSFRFGMLKHLILLPKSWNLTCSAKPDALCPYPLNISCKNGNISCWLLKNRSKLCKLMAPVHKRFGEQFHFWDVIGLSCSTRTDNDWVVPKTPFTSDDLGNPI